MTLVTSSSDDYTRNRSARFEVVDFCDDLVSGLGNECDCGNVRRDSHTGMPPQWMVGRQRLLPKNVERCSAQMSGVKQFDQVVFDEQFTSSYVDDIAPGLEMP